MIIYVLGNPLIKEDSLPLKIIPVLQKFFPKIDFIIVDPNENFPPQGEKELIILDTVIGINKAMILGIDDFNPPASGKKTPVSPHDYDLLFHLLIAAKLGKINNVKIIGIPSQIYQSDALDQVKKIIKNLL